MASPRHVFEIKKLNGEVQSLRAQNEILAQRVVTVSVAMETLRRDLDALRPKVDTSKAQQPAPCVDDASCSTPAYEEDDDWVKPPANEPEQPPAYSSLPHVSLFKQKSEAPAETLTQQAQSLIVRLSEQGDFTAVACLGAALAEKRMETVARLVERHTVKSEAELEKAGM